MKKALIITACITALVLGMIYGLWQDGTKPGFGIIPFILFGMALVAGFIRRLVVARRAGNLREGFQPLRDASTAFENMAAGRDAEFRPGVIQHHPQHPDKDPLA
ncbi:hypothetical protein QMQ05_04430 [Glutamicibacter ectropisis]|uniref:Uncharacterized protein n=1 Tax=Glutamicibacter ectropisis TaxID=3046593 RepID=A0AAU6WG31_9MICC